MSAGYIYILINESYGNRVKIGKTNRSPEQRAKELSSSTGVPTRFHIAYDEYVLDCDLAEKVIHGRLETYRVNKRREFFEIPLKDAIKIVAEVTQEIGNKDFVDKVSPEERVYGFVQLALAYQTLGQKAKAIQVASEAMRIWLDEVGGYNLYIPGLETVDLREDEIIKRFGSVFLSDELRKNNPLLAAQIEYFPCELTFSLNEKEPQERLNSLFAALRATGHPAIHNLISEFYSKVGNEPQRVDHYLQFRLEIYRRTRESDLGCIAYIVDEQEKLYDLSHRIADARQIHNIAIRHSELVQDDEEREAVFGDFYDLYWSEILALYNLEAEMTEAYKAIFR